MDDKTLLILLGAGALGFYFMSQQRGQQQQPIIIQQPQPAAQPVDSRGGVERILGGIGGAIDGIIEVVK